MNKESSESGMLSQISSDIPLNSNLSHSTEDPANTLRSDLASSPMEPVSSSNGNATSITTPTAPLQHSDKDSDSDFGSDLEIVKVVPRAPRMPGRAFGSNQSEDYTDKETDSELTSLDSEINNILNSASTLPSQKNIVLQRDQGPFATGNTKYPLIHEVLPDFYMPHQANEGDPPPGYRAIPPNLVYAIHRELNLWMERSSSDELEVTEQLVFSLKDPIVKTKIMLPVKSTTCRHFECFDFQTFCRFYDIKPGIQAFLKEGLMQQSREARESEALFKEQLQKIHAGKLSREDPQISWPNFSEHGQMFFSQLYHRTPPLYKCPLCDEKFGLKQLYISDIFNYFVRFTPKHISKVQLDGTWFKIVEEDQREKKIESAEVVDLSEEEEGEDEENADNQSDEMDDDDVKSEPKSFVMKDVVPVPSMKSPERMSMNPKSDDFDDGLDDVLLAMRNGDGSWSHPVTLD